MKTKQFGSTKVEQTKHNKNSVWVTSGNGNLIRIHFPEHNNSKVEISTFNTKNVHVCKRKETTVTTEIY